MYLPIYLWCRWNNINFFLVGITALQPNLLHILVATTGHYSHKYTQFPHEGTRPRKKATTDHFISCHPGIELGNPTCKVSEIVVPISVSSALCRLSWKANLNVGSRRQNLRPSRYYLPLTLLCRDRIGTGALNLIQTETVRQTHSRTYSFGNFP